MLVCYPNTTYQVHGNYVIHYSLTLSFYNPTVNPQAVTVTLQTPV
jgi:hypothetical protein